MDSSRQRSRLSGRPQEPCSQTLSSPWKRNPDSRGETVFLKGRASEMPGQGTRPALALPGCRPLSLSRLPSTGETEVSSHSRCPRFPHTIPHCEPQQRRNPCPWPRVSAAGVGLAVGELLAPGRTHALGYSLRELSGQASHFPCGIRYKKNSIVLLESDCDSSPLFGWSYRLRFGQWGTFPL